MGVFIPFFSGLVVGQPPSGLETEAPSGKDVDVEGVWGIVETFGVREGLDECSKNLYFDDFSRWVREGERGGV